MSAGEDGEKCSFPCCIPSAGFSPVLVKGSVMVMDGELMERTGVDGAMRIVLWAEDAVVTVGGR